jgi:glycosyltransferase involved in cell wall biosynthesis
MRILLATPAYWPAVAFGGPTWAAKELAEALVRQGHEVEVLTTSLRAIGSAPASRIRSRTEEIGGVTVHYLATPFRYRWMGITPTLPWRLARGRRPDVVHLFGYRDVVTTVTSWWARRVGVSYVLEPLDMYVRRYRNLPLKQAFDRLFGEPVARHASLVVAVSRWERGQLIEAGITSDRVKVRPNGFPSPSEHAQSNALRRRIGVDADVPVVLSVGRISFKKGLDLLLRAVSDLPGVHLAVIGPDDGDGTQGQLIALRDELALGERVHFLGPSDQHGPGAAYGEANVFVLASRNESFGMVAAEAAAAGTASVITDRCGVAELLADRGALVVPCELEPIRDAIGRLLADPELRLQLGEGGKAVARETTWDDVAAQQVVLYRLASDMQ